jgi:tRNA splicing ligase
MNIEEKRKQIIEEVEKLEKKLDGWKFRKGASKLDENEVTVIFEKVVNKTTGYPDYYVGFYGKITEDPVFNSCFVETWDRNDSYSLMANYRFHGYIEDEKMNIEQLANILENIDKIENLGKEFKRILEVGK